MAKRGNEIKAVAAELEKHHQPGASVRILAQAAQDSLAALSKATGGAS